MRKLPILVVEQHAELAKYIAYVLDLQGYKLSVANSLADALRLLAGQAYSLIVANYFGPEQQLVYRWPMMSLLARFAPSTPVLAICALDKVPISDNVVGALKLPFDEVDLRQAVKLYAATRPQESRDPLLERYLAGAWDANAEEAANAVAEAQAAGWSAEAIYEDLFAEALYVMGDLWGLDSCSVADEHGTRAITERLMATVAAHVKKRATRDQRGLVACFAGEQHELGARMVADLLTWDGWIVQYLGADTPGADVADKARRQRSEFVGLSAAIRPSWGLVKAQIAALRESGVDVVILGGQAFRSMDNAAVASLGADGVAYSARDGVAMANKLVTLKAS